MRGDDWRVVKGIVAYLIVEYKDYDKAVDSSQNLQPLIPSLNPIFFSPALGVDLL